MAKTGKMTVEEALRRVAVLKRDVDYVAGLEEKWRGQQHRFPIIYKGIRKQAEAFKARIDQLKNIKVETTIEEIDRLRQGKSTTGTVPDASQAD